MQSEKIQYQRHFVQHGLTLRKTRYSVGGDYPPELFTILYFTFLLHSEEQGSLTDMY